MILFLIVNFSLMNIVLYTGLIETEMEGVVLFVHDGIPAKIISIKKLSTKSLLLELNLRKKRWLINCFYNPGSCNIESHLDTFSKSLDIHLNRYENVILLGDLRL